MSWLDYKALIVNRNADPAAWRAARKANPNEHEFALWNALHHVLTESSEWDTKTAMYEIAMLMLKLVEAAAAVGVGDDQNR